MASSPITSWQIVGAKMEAVTDFIFLFPWALKPNGKISWCPLTGAKIIADGDCSHEIKRRLLLGRKVMTNLDSIFKSRDICQQRSV